MNTDIKTVKQMRENKRFVVNQPFTPLDLISEITNDIAVNSNNSILVFFTIEWALYLKSIGYTDITVSANDSIVANICKLRGLKYIDTFDLENSKNMKFDVIVGNPPFQSDGNNGSHGLWQKFVALAAERSNNCAVLITPHWHNWAAPTSSAIGINKKGQVYDRKSGGDYDVFRSGRVKKLVMLPSKKYFDVGSTFCWTMIVNNGVTSTEVVCEDRSVLHIDFTSSTGLPSVLTPNTFSIYSKLLQFGELRPFMDHQTINIKKAHYRDTPEPGYEYKWIYSAGKEGVRYRWIAEKSNNYHQWKVLIPISAAGNAYKYASVQTNCNQSQDVSMFLFDCEQDARMFLKTIQLPFFNKLLKMNTGTSKHAKLILPAIDFSRSWSDVELYAHFNLTQAEIDLIEATVK